MCIRDSHAIEHRKQKHQGIANDPDHKKSFWDFLDEVMVNIMASIDPGFPIYMFMADSFLDGVAASFKKHGGHLSNYLIWDKEQFVLNAGDYHLRHELILYGWQKGAAHRWCGDRKQVSIFSFPRARSNDLHPTMKPVDLLCEFLYNSSSKNDLILDPFGGSGSTLVACEQTGRRCCTIELSPNYCDVIVERWEKLTGRKAKRLSNGNDSDH
jgi:DNA modification methylase